MNYKIEKRVFAFYKKHLLGVSILFPHSKVKLATIVEGDPKAPFSIACYTNV